MKTIKSVLILTLLIGNILTAKAQTEEETIDWLIKELNEGLTGRNFFTDNLSNWASDNVKVVKLDCKEIVITLDVDYYDFESDRKVAFKGKFVIAMYEDFELKRGESKMRNAVGGEVPTFFTGLRGVKFYNVDNDVLIMYLDYTFLVRNLLGDTEKINQAFKHLKELCR